MRGVDASAADRRSLSFFSVATLREIAAEMFAVTFPNAGGNSDFSKILMYTIFVQCFERVKRYKVI